MRTSLRNQVILFQRLESMGFTFDEAQALRRIEMTLHRWAESECGDGNDYASWCIERDETTGKPYRCVYPHQGKMHRTAIPDREKGALKRLAGIVEARNKRKHMPNHEDKGFVIPYHQGDCRGCSLYLVRKSDIPAGANLGSCYTVGVAVAA